MLLDRGLSLKNHSGLSPAFETSHSNTPLIPTVFRVTSSSGVRNLIVSTEKQIYVQ